MTAYTVRAYLNCDRDSYEGFRPGHLLAHDADLTYAVDQRDEMAAAESLFAIGNRHGHDETGREWPSDVRSLSVGDLVLVCERDTSRAWMFACERVGFAEVDAIGEGTKPSRIVPLAGQERAGSR